MVHTGPRSSGSDETEAKMAEEEEIDIDCLPQQSHLARQYKILESHFQQKERLENLNMNLNLNPNLNLNTNLDNRSSRLGENASLLREVKVLIRRLGMDRDHYKKAYEDLTKTLSKVKNPAEKIGHTTAFDSWIKEDAERFLATAERNAEVALLDLEFLRSELETEAQIAVSQQGSTNAADRLAGENSAHNASSAIEERRFQQETAALSRLPRLPPLPLPVFDGNCLEFPEWFERFNETVHSRADVSDAEKMSYLLSCVQGTARIAITQFPITASGYTSAMDLLKESFGMKQSDERTLAVQIETLTAASYSWNDQLCLTLTLKALVARMARTRESIQKDITLQEMITRKFQPQLRDKLHRFAYQAENITVKSILDKAEALIREELFVTSMNVPTGRNKGELRQVINVARGNATDFHPNNARNQQFEVTTEEQKCVYCGKHKKSKDCYSIRLITDRINFLKKHGLCIACLKPDSTVHRCDVRCSICEKEHDQSICMQWASMKQSHKRYQNDRRKKGTNRRGYDESEQGPGSRQQGRQRVMTNQVCEMGGRLAPRLQTGQVTVRGIAEGESERVAFLLDTGATISLVSEKLARKLSLRKLHNIESTICGLGDRTEGRKTYSVYEVPLQSVTGKRLTIKAMGFPEPILGKLEYPPLPQTDVEEIRRRSLKMADDYLTRTTLDPQLLLGNKDYLMVTRVKEQRINLSSGYVLLPSLLGWIATGGTFEETQSSVVAHLIDRKTVKKEVNDAIHKFLALDDCVKMEDTDGFQKDLSEADEYFRDNVRVEEGRIHAKYCLKDQALVNLSSNLNAAYARMRNVIPGLKKRRMLEKYDSLIQDHIAKNHAEEIEPEEWNEAPHSYLPHHPVYRMDKPLKPIRIVFDASAKERGKLSLNECMKDVKIRLERIPALLLRARCAFSVLLSDVEAAFLQIGVDQSQRDLLRFLWVRDLSKPIHDNNVMHLRFKVAPFGVSQSPFLLESAIRYHVEQQVRQSENTNKDSTMQFVLEQMKNNVYVDNVIFECERNTDKFEVYRKSKALFERIGMNLREFASDSTDFVDSLPAHDKGKIGMQKILGVQWCSKTDELLLQASISQEGRVLTKRVVLSKLASTFDPLGLMAPLLLPAKLFVQQLWSKDYGWDTPLNEQDKKAWSGIERDMLTFSHALPRRILEPNAGWMLVAFADASSKSIAASVYIVGQGRANLAMARSQLAPVRSKSTIPRLELRAMLLAVKLLRFVSSSLSKTPRTKVSELLLFTDSTIALYWESGRINKNEEKGSRNITNTVKGVAEEKRQICQELHGRDCKLERDCIKSYHVCSEENPADLATRGVKSHKLSTDSSLWWHGPDWLTLEGVRGRKPWNPDEVPATVVEEANQHDKAQPVLVLSDGRKSAEVIDTNRFSSLLRMKRTIAYVKRFIRIKMSKLKGNLQEKYQSCFGVGPQRGHLTAEELTTSEMTIAKLHQQANLDNIRDPGNKELQLFQDDKGLYRCGHHRLINADLPYSHKYPIFIPARNGDTQIVKLLVRAAHYEVMHAGENHTLDFLRQKYWIARARRAVRRVLKECVPCRKSLALPFKYPAAPDLPKERVNVGKPFSRVGLDYAGPFRVRINDEKVKSYILVITCMVTRATHLEVTSNLSAIAFMAAFRRFVSRRGAPEHVLSDNAPTFHCAKRTLQERGHDDDMYTSYLAKKGITWTFTPPHAPWQGGIYERMVGLIKACLARTLGRNILDRDEFVTTVTEIESVLISRPLTELSNDIRDQDRILRPVDFLMPMGSNAGIMVGEPNVDNDEEYQLQTNESRALGAHYREVEKRLQRLWELFTNSYMLSLKSKTMASLKTGRSCGRIPTVGELVLIQDEMQPRGCWPLARIVECQDREATVRTSSGNILIRPTNLLVPLEVYTSIESPIANHESSNGLQATQGTPDSTNSRPIRGCKSLARDPAYWQLLRK